MYRTKIDVRYSETDKMGIVYHANYFRGLRSRAAGLQSNTVLIMPKRKIADLGCRLPIAIASL